MFICAGYVFDPRLQYSLTVWTSAGTASTVVAGNIGWRCNKGADVDPRIQRRSRQPIARRHLSVLPANRSKHGRQLLRPGFTQGAWASGEPVKGLNYLAFVGNGLAASSGTSCRPRALDDGRADARAQGAAQRRLYAVHRGLERLGAPSTGLAF
jgi:hypothetical protein